MRTYRHIDFSLTEQIKICFYLGGSAKSVETLYVDAEIMHSFARRSVMLIGQNRSRRNESDLFAFFYYFKRHPQSNFGFSVPYVSAKQSVHYFAACQIGYTIVNRSNLIVGRGIRKRRFEIFEQRKVRRIYMSFAFLTFCVQFEQRKRHFFYGRFYFGFYFGEIRSAYFT
ncbi:unknown [Firmicutes bacterium CAG:552]|nr:unknown [Firmicutes bacterium CAG:552]